MKFLNAIRRLLGLPRRISLPVVLVVEPMGYVFDGFENGWVKREMVYNQRGRLLAVGRIL
jgi:hypothetical protein